MLLTMRARAAVLASRLRAAFSSADHYPSVQTGRMPTWVGPSSSLLGSKTPDELWDEASAAVRKQIVEGNYSVNPCVDMADLTSAERNPTLLLTEPRPYGHSPAWLGRRFSAYLTSRQGDKAKRMAREAMSSYGKWKKGGVTVGKRPWWRL